VKNRAKKKIKETE